MRLITKLIILGLAIMFIFFTNIISISNNQLIIAYPNFNYIPELLTDSTSLLVYIFIFFFASFYVLVFTKPEKRTYEYKYRSKRRKWYKCYIIFK